MAKSPSRATQSRATQSRATPSRAPAGLGTAGAAAAAARASIHLAPAGRFPLVAGLVLIVAGLAAYSNSLSGPFLFDDLPRIAENPAIRTLWPVWVPMSTTNRPLGTYTFAINYALDGYHVWGYHATNLAIHLACGLLLLGIVRRTLAESRRAVSYRALAGPLALTVALLWVLHPLGTAAVTYIVQRLESLMAMFYLATLYAFVRAQHSRWSGWWYAVAVVCCALGMGTKEVMVTAPLLVLWYDRALVAEDWRSLVARRIYFYVALAATWSVLAWSMLHWHGDYSVGAIGQVDGLTPLSYLLSQAGVLAHYLRLCFWPWRQCFDYGWPVAHSLGEILPPLAMICTLAAATVWSVLRRPAWGFLGGTFFVVLAPTSSVVPVKDLAFEHRMYLPAAAVVAAAVLGASAAVEALARRRPSWAGALWTARAPLAAGAALVLGILTFAHNGLYRHEISLWRDALVTAPHNARALCNLGHALTEHDETDEAIVCFERALEIKADFVEAEYDLGTALNEQGRFAEAVGHLRAAIQLKPDYPGPHHNLAAALDKLGQFDEAVTYFLKAIEFDPQFAQAYNSLGLALCRRGRLLEATGYLCRAAEIKPDNGIFRNDLGAAFYATRQYPQALAQLERAVELEPASASVHYNLANTLAATLEYELAVVHYEAAVESDPAFEMAAYVHSGLAGALAALDRPEEALAEYRAALAIKPDLVDARFKLAQGLNAAGRTGEATAEYRRVLEFEPKHDGAARELRTARGGGRDSGSNARR